ncbi:MAG: 50S ribosomal protein L1 [Cytophagales bacterium]
MGKQTKNRKAQIATYDSKKSYPLTEAIEIAKKSHFAKFDASLDMAAILTIDAKNPLHAIRTSTVLSHGTGKTVRVLALCPPDKETEAKEAGADYVGSDVYVTKIEKGWTDFDVMVTTPSLMGVVGKLGRVLGPKELMPTIKRGTITQNIAKKIKEIRLGEITLKTDKTGIVHTTLGRISFPTQKLVENAQEAISTIKANKHATVKGDLIKKITCSTTMGLGINIALTSI